MRNSLYLAAALAVAHPAAALASPQSSEVTKLFETFCLASDPSMAVLEARAKAIQGTKQIDKTIPIGPDRHLHQATWLVRGPSGIYQIIAMQADMATGKNQSVGCGVTAPSADGTDLAQTLATEGGLGGPVRRVDAAGQGANSVVWNRQFGTRQGHILLSWGAPNTRGTSLRLIVSDMPAAGEQKGQEDIKPSPQGNRVK